MLHDSGRSRVIVCHSREIGNILLYYYQLEYINGGNDKVIGQGYGLGIDGCKRLCPVVNGA